MRRQMVYLDADISTGQIKDFMGVVAAVQFIGRDIKTGG